MKLRDDEILSTICEVVKARINIRKWISLLEINVSSDYCDGKSDTILNLKFIK